MRFSRQIIDWYNINKRDLPWRKTKDPYFVWLSEVILQQTRIAQGLSYYKKFVEHYPSVYHLAKAEEEEVLNLWQGLGYYSRARNLHKAARQVVDEYGGEFPRNYKALLQLKGVGEYTAAAIASICYGEKVAVVDGNVYRVLARYFNISIPIDASQAKKYFKATAQELLPEGKASDFNQAMMELGALVCTPKSAKCKECPLSKECLAFAKQNIYEFPKKGKKPERRNRYFNFLVLKDKSNFLLQKRTQKDIWKNLYQFPLLESTEELKTSPFDEEGRVLKHRIKARKHVLSHQNIHAVFWKYEGAITQKILEQEKAIKVNNTEEKPLPKLIENYLQEHPI